MAHATYDRNCEPVNLRAESSMKPDEPAVRKSFSVEISGSKWEKLCAVRKTEGREVTVEEWVLVVPFSFDSYSVFVVVNVVRGSECFFAVSRDFNIKALLNPSTFKKETVDGSGDWRFVSAFLGDIASS